MYIIKYTIRTPLHTLKEVQTILPFHIILKDKVNDFWNHLINDKTCNNPPNKFTIYWKIINKGTMNQSLCIDCILARCEKQVVEMPMGSDIWVSILNPHNSYWRLSTVCQRIWTAQQKAGQLSNKEYNWNRIQITWLSFCHPLIDDTQENKVSKIRKVEETIFMYTVTLSHNFTLHSWLKSVSKWWIKPASSHKTTLK